MKSKYLIVLISIVCYSCTPEMVAEEYDLANHRIIDSSRMIILETLLTQFVSSTQLSIAIVHQDTTNYYGIEKQGNVYRSINNRNSVFEIGSITKNFTGAMVMDLSLDSMLDLKQPVKDFFDCDLYASSKDGVEMKVLDLANHSSGLPSQPRWILEKWKRSKDHSFAGFEQVQFDEFLQFQIEPECKPGTRFQYSNNGFGLLGVIAERVSEESYESLLQKKIVIRYDLKNTTSDITKVNNEIVQGLTENGKPAPYFDCGIYYGAGAVFSNVIDLAKYTDSCMRGDLLFTKQCEHLFPMDDSTHMSFNWRIWHTKEYGDLYYTLGGTTGFSSVIFMHPESNGAVIILSNVSNDSDRQTYVIGMCYALLVSYINSDNDHIQ